MARGAGSLRDLASTWPVHWRKGDGVSIYRMIERELRLLAFFMEASTYEAAVNLEKVPPSGNTSLSL